MPIYLYRCPKCKDEKEVEHGMEEKVQVNCPCDGIDKDMVKLINFQGRINGNCASQNS